MTERRHRSAGGTRRPPYADGTGASALPRPGGADRPPLVDGSRFWDHEPRYDMPLRPRRAGALSSLTAVAAVAAVLALVGLVLWLAWPGSGRGVADGPRTPREGALGGLAPGRSGGSPGTGARPAESPRDGTTAGAAPGTGTSPGIGPTATPRESALAEDGPPGPRPLPEAPVRVPSARPGGSGPGHADGAARGDAAARGDGARSRRPGEDRAARPGNRGEPRGGRASRDAPGHGGEPLRPARVGRPGDAARNGARREAGTAGTGVGRGPGARPGPWDAGDPGDPLSAAYACRHISPFDWRYPYCVQVWNNHRRWLGIDRR